MLGSSYDTGTRDAVTAAIGKTIQSAVLENSNVLRLTFTDGMKLLLWDDSQCCCESRYMTCDDDLGRLSGETLTDISTAEAPSGTDGEYGDCHETMFLNIQTNLGQVQLVTHNEHNGYYGGLDVSARLEDA